MIQVRLDDDAEALVRANKAAHGGSLSKAANRLLRASASKPTLVFSTVTSQTAPAGTDSAAFSTFTPAPKPKRVGRCSHPILRRVGNACMVCGATIG